MTYLNKKIAVVTSITGGYDCLRKQMPNIDGIDYFCITDSAIQPIYNWKIINYKFPDYMNAKFKSFETRYKLLTMFNGYDYVIWQDASIELNDNFIKILNQFIKEDYDFSVVVYGKDINYDLHLKMMTYTFMKNLGHDMAVENSQMLKYLNDRNWSLSNRSTINAALRIFKNNEKCKWFNQLMFNELIYLNQYYINDKSKYGQMWHNFYYDELINTYFITLTQNMFKIYLMPIDIFDSDYCIKYKHNSMTEKCGDYTYKDINTLKTINVFFNNNMMKNSLP